LLFLIDYLFDQLLINIGEDFWRWQTMNPKGYRTEKEIEASKAKSVDGVNGTANGIHGTNGSH